MRTSGLLLAHIVGLCTTTSLLASCGSDSHSSISQSMLNGEVVSDDPRLSAVGALVFSQKESATCTATLISPRVAVTAGHCFSNLDQHIDDMNWVSGNLKEPQWKSRVVSVRQVQTALDEGSYPGDDVAVVFLRDAAPYDPFVVGDLSGAPIGETFRLVSYGRSSPGFDNVTPKSDRVSAAFKLSASSGKVWLMGMDRQTCEEIKGSEAQSACLPTELVEGYRALLTPTNGHCSMPGDSGGALVQADGSKTNTIYGVDSYGYHDNDRNCAEAGTIFGTFGPAVRQALEEAIAWDLETPPVDEQVCSTLEPQGDEITIPRHDPSSTDWVSPWRAAAVASPPDGTYVLKEAQGFDEQESHSLQQTLRISQGGTRFEIASTRDQPIQGRGLADGFSTASGTLVPQNDGGYIVAWDCPSFPSNTTLPQGALGRQIIQFRITDDSEMLVGYFGRYRYKLLH